MKIIYRSLFISVLILILAACANSSNSNNTEDSNGNNSNDEFVLKMNTTYPPAKHEDEPKYLAIEKFAETVDSRTDGRVKIEIYQSNQLVPQKQMLKALSSGTIDMGVGGAYYGDELPTQDFLWLPFAFEGVEHARHLMRDTEIGEIFANELEENNVKMLMSIPFGINTILSKKPITNADDMKGMKLRLPTGLWTEWFKELGVSPVNIDTSENYQALERGTMDGTILAYNTLDTYNLYEVIDHVTVPGVSDPILVMNYISLDTWNELPSDLQEIILEVSKEIEDEADALVLENNKKDLEFAEENGVTINYLSDDELAKMREASRIVWDEFANRNEDTQKMMEILEESIK